MGVSRVLASAVMLLFLGLSATLSLGAASPVEKKCMIVQGLSGTSDGADLWTEYWNPLWAFTMDDDSFFGATTYFNTTYRLGSGYTVATGVSTVADSQGTRVNRHSPFPSSFEVCTAFVNQTFFGCNDCQVCVTAAKIRMQATKDGSSGDWRFDSCGCLATMTLKQNGVPIAFCDLGSTMCVKDASVRLGHIQCTGEEAVIS